MIKKTISILLVLSLLLIIMPFSALSAGAVVSGSFSYEVLDNGTAEITGYTGNALTLEIPSVIDGYTVTSIGEYAFFDKRDFNKVIIPNTVTNIGAAAFGGMDYDCNLQLVEIPDSVTTIGAYAFLNCQNMLSIRIPASVTYIGNYALGSYYYYRESLGDYYFIADDSGSFVIYCQEESMAYYYADYYGIAYKFGPKKSGDILYSVLSDGTAEITEYTGKAKKVTIPDIIGGYTVSTIGKYAFSTKTIQEVVIPETAELIDVCAFYDCPYLWSVTIPEGVQTISAEAFVNCPNLNDVTIPRSVKEIGTYALGVNCDPETWEYWTDGTLKIRGYRDSAAETYANSIQLTFELITQQYGDYVYTVLDDGTAVIEKYLGNEADLHIPEELEGYAVTMLDKKSFVLCKTLRSVHIPYGVTDICQMAFYGCIKLENVYLPDSLKVIESFCFDNCYALDRLYMPHTAVTLYGYAFGFITDENNKLQLYPEFCPMIYKDSGPQSYCEYYKMDFLYYLYGDADCDGEVSVIDVSCIQRKINKMEFAGEINLNCAVVSGSNELSVIDATLIQRYLAKVGTGAAAPIGEPVPLNPDTVG